MRLEANGPALWVKVLVVGIIALCFGGVLWFTGPLQFLFRDIGEPPFIAGPEDMRLLDQCQGTLVLGEPEVSFRTLRLIDIPTRKEVSVRLQEEALAVSAVGAEGTVAYLSNEGDDHVVRQLDLRSGVEKQLVRGAERAGPFCELEYSPDGRFLAVRFGLASTNFKEMQKGLVLSLIVLDMKSLASSRHSTSPAVSPIWLDGHRVLKGEGQSVFELDVVTGKVTPLDALNKERHVDSSPNVPGIMALPDAVLGWVGDEVVVYQGVNTSGQRAERSHAFLAAYDYKWTIKAAQSGTERFVTLAEGVWRNDCAFSTVRVEELFASRP